MFNPLNVLAYDWVGIKAKVLPALVVVWNLGICLWVWGITERITTGVLTNGYLDAGELGAIFIAFSVFGGWLSFGLLFVDCKR